MQARTDNPALTVPGALAAAENLEPSATTAAISESTLYLPRFAGLFRREG